MDLNSDLSCLRNVKTGREVELTTRLPTVDGESDHFIVVGERESRLQGEGTDSYTQLAKETYAGQVGPE